MLLIECTRSVCLNVLTLSYSGTWGFRSKSRPNCVPLEGKYKSDRKKQQEAVQMTESEKREGGCGGVGVQKKKRVPVRPRDVWKCNSYFYRSTTLILGEGEIAHSFAVITFTCTLVELFMKDLNRGYVMGKRIFFFFFFTNNTKSKKALKWTKKMSHQP